MIDVQRFDWDDEHDVNGNSWHICVQRGKRNIWEEDVESVFDNEPLVIREPSGGKNPYYTVIGRDQKGRLLEIHGVYFQDPPKEFWFRPITAMKAREKYQKKYFSSGRK